MAGTLQELTGMWIATDADELGATNAVDDAALVQAARRDTAAFAALYRRYVTPVYRYLCSRAGNEADAQDLTAQVFLEALESLHRYHDRGNFAAWLFTIARRRAIDHYRHRPTLTLEEIAEPADDRDPLSNVMRHESLVRLAALVSQLNDDQRELLRLRFAAGLTFGQMGNVLGRREAAVKMAVHRLLEHLKDQWGATDD